MYYWVQIYFPSTLALLALPFVSDKNAILSCIADHYEEFVQVYDERYEREYRFWRPVIAEVIEKYLECGDLTHGFARVRFEHCGHEYILSLSSKASSIQHRLLIFVLTKIKNLAYNFISKKQCLIKNFLSASAYQHHWGKKVKHKDKRACL
jgi:hypothetical protein